jgi:flagellar hook-associated protein 2
MATISSAGAAEGVDLRKVMSNASLARLNTETPRPPQLEDVAEISSSGMRQSAITALAEAASQLTSKALWSSTVASSGAPAAVSARSNDQTPAGAYKVEVAQVASAQVTNTATFSSLSTVVGLGTLNIEMGSWDVPPTTFATNPNWPKANVVLGPKNDTLDRVRDKINAAGLGVVATVVSDATGSRLVLRSTGTGADNGFKITTEEADAPKAPAESGSDVAALSALGFDPSSMGTTGMQLLQSASNAKVQINDEAVESPLNAIESQAGLSLILKSPTDAPVTINVGPDRTGMQQAAQNFTQAYNALQNLGGSVASAVQRGTEILLGTPDQPSELARTLAQTGMTRTPAGELQINTQQLSTALQQDSAAVRQSQTMLAQQVLADLPANPTATSPDAGALAQPNTDLAANSPSSTAGTLLRQRLLDQYQGLPSQTGMEDIDSSFLPVASRA